MDILTIFQLYAAILVVILLHEFGHFPKKLKIQLFPIPSASAMQAKYRLGGLIVNVLIFLGVWYYKPESIFIQYAGLFAWLHFIVYSVIGSIMPEPSPNQVNTRTYVFDDVPNEFGIIFIISAIFSYLILKSYYLPILFNIVS